MSNLKRILIAIFCVALIASLFVLPASASAASSIAASASIIASSNEPAFASSGSIDLLDTDSINIRWKGSDYPYKGIERYASTEAVEFEFNLPTINQDIDFILLNVYLENIGSSSITPALVNLDNDTSVDFTGSLVGSYGNIYQYKFTLDRPIHFARVQLFWSSPITGYIGLSSFRGYYDVSEPVLGGTVYTNFFYRNKATGLQYVVNSGGTALTFPAGKGQSVIQDMTDYKYQVTLDIPKSRRVLNSYDSITFYFFASAVPENIGVILYESGNEAEIIPDDNISFHSFSNSSMPGFSGSGTAASYPDVTYVALQCDLSGYDLSSQTISLSFDIPPSDRWIDAEDSDQNFWFSIDRVFLTPEVEDPTWYQKFWSWMSGGLISLGDRIVEAIGGISFPESTEDPSSPLKDPVVGFETAASDFNEAMDIVESVTKPSVEVNPEVILPTLDPITINTMAILTGDETILLMLGVVVSLCIISILLFGRRD